MIKKCKSKEMSSVCSSRSNSITRICRYEWIHDSAT